MTVLAQPSASRPLWKVLDETPPEMMLRYFRKAAAELSAESIGRQTLVDWEARRLELRGQLWKSLGNFPLADRPAIRARVTGTIDHGDHTIEKIVYESLPGLYVTALVYVPKYLTDRAPAVICVNGHWPKAKATSIIQRRCIMLARMGVIAFCQDVIGTGERAAFEGSPPTTYHGFYRGATPRIVDRSLLGYMIYECLRANDYLRSRADIDPERIMCTGASGGGKQSMFFPALDERLAGGAPVCYVSSYVDHIGATACVGEVPTGVLQYTDQWEILGLHAPRPLLCIAASRDVPVFSPAPMQRTLDLIKERVYRLHEKESQVRFAEFDSKHDYNKPMRELYYSHVGEHLLGKSDFKVFEPDYLPVETDESLRAILPAVSETMQSITYRRANQLVAKHHAPSDKATWQKRRNEMLVALEEKIFGGFPTRDNVRQTRVREIQHDEFRVEHWILETEPGVLVPATFFLPSKNFTSVKVPAVLVVDQEGKESALERDLVEPLVSQGQAVLAIDTRGTGETAGTVPAIGYGPGTPEYNLSNYALFLGRPLMGMRVHDIRCALDFLTLRKEIDTHRLTVAGRGRGALASLIAAIFDDRIHAVITEELLSSWVFAEEFVDIGLSSLIPRILTVGDIQHLAACISPRPLLVLNPVDGRNRKLLASQAENFGRFTEAIYNLDDASNRSKTIVAREKDVPAIITHWLSGEQ
jgi:cephalosporin-C deacetylase-like acetyl esterase